MQDGIHLLGNRHLHACLARQADVSYRRIWENRLDRQELDRVERVLIARESAHVEDGQ